MLLLSQLLFLALLSLSFVAAKPRMRQIKVPLAESEYLAAHNSVRSQHQARPLSWSFSLASKAQQWANECQLKHSKGSLMPEKYGENLAAGAGKFAPSAAVKVFTGDASQYDPAHPTYKLFTQVVWKSTTELGCASAQCSNLFDKKYGPATYHVCLYNPPGNVIGEAPANVHV